MKNEKFKSAAAIALAVMVCVTSLTACGSGGKKTGAGKDAPKQSQQVETKKTSKKPSTDNKGSPSLKEDLAKKDDAPAVRQPAADPGEDPAFKDTSVKDKEGSKTPAAEDIAKKDSTGTEKAETNEDGKGGAAKKTAKKKKVPKKDLTQQKGSQKKSGTQKTTVPKNPVRKPDAPAAKLSASTAPGKTPAVNQGNQSSAVKGTEKKDAGSAAKGTEKKSSAAKKADAKKPSVKAPSVNKNAPAPGKAPTVNSGK